MSNAYDDATAWAGERIDNCSTGLEVVKYEDGSILEVIPMAEHNLTAQKIASSGTTPTYLTSASTPTPLTVGTIPDTGAVTGDQFVVQNDGRTFLHGKTGATAVTMDILTVPVLDGIALDNRHISIPANAERVILPDNRDVYGFDFKFAVTPVTNLEIAVLQV